MLLDGEGHVRITDFGLGERRSGHSGRNMLARHAKPCTLRMLRMHGGGATCMASLVAGAVPGRAPALRAAASRCAAAGPQAAEPLLVTTRIRPPTTA